MWAGRGGNHAQAAVGTGDQAALTRWFTSANTTTNLYVSWVMNVQTPGVAQYAGLEILGGAGGNTALFRAGLTPGSANAGIQSLLNPGQPSSNSTITIQPGVDYTFVLKYVKAYPVGAAKTALREIENLKNVLLSAAWMVYGAVLMVWGIAKKAIPQ